MQQYSKWPFTFQASRQKLVCYRAIGRLSECLDKEVCMYVLMYVCMNYVCIMYV